MLTTYGEKKKQVVIQEPIEEESIENTQNVEKVNEKVESLSGYCRKEKEEERKL